MPGDAPLVRDPEFTLLCPISYPASSARAKWTSPGRGRLPHLPSRLSWIRSSSAVWFF